MPHPSTLASESASARGGALLGALISTGDPAADEAFLRRLRPSMATPQERASNAQRMAGAVRGLAIDQWPRSWTLYEALAVAMWLGLEPTGLVERLNALGFRATLRIAASS